MQVGTLKPSLTKTLERRYRAIELPEGEDRETFLAEHGGDVTAVVTSGRFGVQADLMDRLPKLGAVVNFGVGFDTTDVEAAQARNIVVSNTPDVLTDCVADTAVALLLDVMRGFSAADRFVRAGRWPSEGNPPLTRQASNRRVGILGLGRIGGAIAHRLVGFNCTISYHNRREVAASPYTYYADLAEMAREVDVLVIAAAGGAGTSGLVTRDVLAALGPKGYLVNIARGSVVDEDALVELLLAGQLAGAGLDVFAHEPKVPQALLELDNVVLLPHVGSGTVETRAAMEELTLANLDNFLHSGTVLNPVY
ncbi:lactate dehydrogenase-like 2-hydroxyacid dehydrogenase [Kineosporia succinea]|uniref:Lactate dehydrogenase-like 2-hydroxyacid dehydrogenase n=1 Tax=Kineosporia succinea TaxID=84632 RepID=A0ABT9P229_9ACTN|nr:2-hydroxyacid dehydrogenase [Kineosporia succinea]MDP9826734.1 lactate dehydrogenase-like 2-hydroxyacid dehydrogenase [Kineosporia succinea]